MEESGRRTRVAFARDEGWFKDHKSKDPRIGIALSGGGIRSATFNLGILSVLREKGLLKCAGYLSTVSGGGYIGGWLAGNCSRTDGFLEPGAEDLWTKSISHLRRYSDYLSPKLGFFSADTWTMVMIWMRNTILIQLALLPLLLLPLALALLTPALSGAGADAATKLVFAALLVLACGFIGWGMMGAKTAQPGSSGSSSKPSQSNVQVLVAIPMMGVAVACMRLLWTLPPASRTSYSGILNATFLNPEYGWWHAGFAGATLLFIWLGMCGMKRGFAQKLAAVAIAVASTAALGALLCLVARYLPAEAPSPWSRFTAITLAPPAILFAFSLSVVLQIGLAGRWMEDGAREWWSRLGAWLGIYGLVWMAAHAVALFSTPFITWCYEAAPRLSQLALPGWLTATLGSVFAAKSDKTNGGKKSGAMELLAEVGPYIFVAGLFVLLSKGLFSALMFVKIDSVPVGGPAYWSELGALGLASIGPVILGCMVLAGVLGFTVDPNEFSLNHFYRNRLVRCYLGATREPSRRKPNPFTGFDFDDDMAMTEFAAKEYDGPFPIVNAAVNLGASSDLSLKSRRASNFVLTPDYAGSSGWPGNNGAAEGYHGKEYYEHCPMTLGAAVATSGAAANPNMGFHTSPAVCFLMTIFNVRLGWWAINTRLASGGKILIGWYALLRELAGAPGDKGHYVNLSDGGHFENLAIYELVRRRCRLIIAGDGEQDGDLTFSSLGNVIRMCEVDLGARIKLDVSAIRTRDANGFSRAHCAAGTIIYANGDIGTILYLKSSVTGDEPTEVHQYRAAYPAFPHQSTGDQFFSEDQFESYLRLGRHIGKVALKNIQRREICAGVDLDDLSGRLRKDWYASNMDSTVFDRNAKALARIWEAMRADASLAFLDRQFFPAWQRVATPPSSAPTSATTVPAMEVFDLPTDPAAFRKGFYLCTEIIQLMENVYLELDLESSGSSPDISGWISLFHHWSWSAMFRATWALTFPTYGSRFQSYCERELGLNPLDEAARAGGATRPALSLRVRRGDEGLNPVERMLFEQSGAAGQDVGCLELVIGHPFDASRDRSYIAGFAIVTNNELRYMRIQDHLRQTGLGGKFLDLVAPQGSPIRCSEAPFSPSLPGEAQDPQAFRAWVARRRPDLLAD